MEFPEVGERCSVASCKQLDFLPVVCDICHEIFCSQHQGRNAHKCIEITNIKDFKTDESNKKSYACDLEECSIIELVSVRCQDCDKNFCLRHRHQQDHRCEMNKKPLENVLTPKEKVEAIIGKELKTASRKNAKSGKQSKTAAKVALMKLKMHAVGDRSIAQVDREYFNVQIPSEDNISSTAPMFFNKTWSIGKIIDNIASIKKLSNKNNEASSKKLRLFNARNQLLDPSQSLQNLIEQGCIEIEADRFLKLNHVDS